MCQYWSVQCNVKRFVKISLDATLNVQILIYSTWCQEICWNLHRRDFESANVSPSKVMSKDLQRFHLQDFERTNIGLFKVMSRDLLKFALTRLWTSNIGLFNVMSIDMWRFALTRLWARKCWSIQCRGFALARLWTRKCWSIKVLSRFAKIFIDKTYSK